jgi:hypothetical protein
MIMTILIAFLAVYSVYAFIQLDLYKLILPFFYLALVVGFFGFFILYGRI